MATKRRKCTLANSNFRDVNLKNYEQIIIDTINNTVPGKDPKVYESYFSTIALNQSEAVKLGRALAKISELSAFGQKKEIFRLFDGKTYDSEEATTPSIKQRPKGGRKR